MSDKPLNSFFLYCKENRSILASSHPKLTNAEVTCLLGKYWRDMDHDTKNKYKRKAKKLREDYEKLHNDEKQNRKDKFRNQTFMFKVNSKPKSSPITKPQISKIESKYRFYNYTPNMFENRNNHRTIVRENSVIEYKRFHNNHHPSQQNYFSAPHPEYYPHQEFYHHPSLKEYYYDPSRYPVQCRNPHVTHQYPQQNLYTNSNSLHTPPVMPQYPCYNRIPRDNTSFDQEFGNFLESLR